MALDFLEQKTKQVSQSRKKKAGAHYKAGLKGLYEIKKEGLRDKSQLRETLTQFMKAIEYKRTETKPYIALAYLFILLESPHISLKYINEALRQDPNSSDALAFKNYLNQPPSQIHESSLSHIDKVYFQIEAVLLDLYQSQPQIRPTLDAIQLKRLKQEHIYFENKVEGLETQIQALDQNLDVQRLHQLMQSLYAQLYAIEHACTQSESLQKTFEKLMQLSRQVKRLYDEVISEIETVTPERQLDYILNQCNSLADEIDTYEKQGLPTVELEGHYNKLILMIENLMDQLD